MRSQKGFSLIELLVATAVLLLMFAGVFAQIGKMQKASQREEVKRDMFQNGREVMDQLNRDLHSAGFPNRFMFNRTGGLNPDNTNQSAAGLVKASPTQIMFEGDIDSDGIVDSVAYQYVTAAPAGTPAGINCGNGLAGNPLPCFVRAQTQKLNGTPLPTSDGGTQNTLANYRVALENVSIPGANSPVFSYYDAAGNVVDTSMAGGLSYIAPPAVNALNSIRTIKVTLNLQGNSPDLDTRTRPAATLTLTSKLNNY